jgi:hypothetical protein
MLLDSLERLAKAESTFHGTFVELQRYFEDHNNWELLDPTLLAADLPDLDVFALAGALEEATQTGELRAKYTVLTPDGVVASDLFDSPSSIPRILPDRFEEEFETRQRPLVTVFEAAQAVSNADEKEDGDISTSEAGS